MDLPAGVRMKKSISWFIIGLAVTPLIFIINMPMSYLSLALLGGLFIFMENL